MESSLISATGARAPRARALLALGGPIASFLPSSARIGDNFAVFLSRIAQLGDVLAWRAGRPEPWVLATRTRAVLLLLVAWGLEACTHAVPYTPPPHWSKDVYRSDGTSSREHPRADDTTGGWSHSASTEGALASRETRSPHRADSATESAGRTPSSSGSGGPPLSVKPRIAPPQPQHAPTVTGKRCLRALQRAGVHFRALDELTGVVTPVEVLGDLGGIDYWANDGRPLQMDCRLALALEALGDVMRRHGVTRVRYSGAYSYRRTRSGRLSHHAHGLAIDLHDFQFGPMTASVDRDFQTGVGCQRGISELNQLTCQVRQMALFEEFLTPDYNADHRDHLHVAIPREQH